MNRKCKEDGTNANRLKFIMKIYEYYTLQVYKKRATKNLLFVIRA